MQSKQIPLREIERAIAVNTILDHKASKILQRPKGPHVNQGLARCVFIFIALKCGYNQEEICDYLTIGQGEYQYKIGILDNFYTEGRKLFNETSAKEHFNASKEGYLFFYRQLLLAQNYLRYMFRYQP